MDKKPHVKFETTESNGLGITSEDIQITLTYLRDSLERILTEFGNKGPSLAMTGMATIVTAIASQVRDPKQRFELLESFKSYIDMEGKLHTEDEVN